VKEGRKEEWRVLINPGGSPSYGGEERRGEERRGWGEHMAMPCTSKAHTTLVAH